MHAAIPVLLLGGGYDSAYEKFLEVWLEIEDLQDEMGDEDPKRNRKRASSILKHFEHSHSGSKALVRLVEPPEGAIEVDEKTSDYEVPWAIDVGLPVPIVGRFDSMCRHRDTDELWIWELKTTSRLTGRFFDAHEMYCQNLVYCLAGATLTTEEIQGIMIEGVLVDKAKVDNQIQPIPTTPHHLEDILRWLRVTGAALLDAEARYLEALKTDSNPEDYFHKDFTGCTPYTHYYMPSFRCEFADLCRVPDYRGMTSLYQVRPDHDFLEVTVNDSVTRKV